MKRFHNDRQLKVYMHAFMYVNPEINPEDYYFSGTKIFVEDYKKILTPGPVPKHWLIFG